ncbi:hypothetical protein BUE80_DR009863 [Diplocarpon rosae]|nr:hypothetical protein BUE80_DR009863 [Diplocarpon rosae]
MSFDTRRALSTLIPPKVASPSGLGAAQDAARMQRVVSFYEKLPRGSAPEVKPTGLLGRYQAKYFGKNPSGTQSEYVFDLEEIAIIHAIVFLVGIGYAQNYYFHLRHHKNNAH